MVLCVDTKRVTEKHGVGKSGRRPEVSSAHCLFLALRLGIPSEN